MELFLDNDIIIKLSAINSLNKIETIFNVSFESVFILPSASAYISKSKKIKEKYSIEVIKNALKAIEYYQVIPENYLDQNKFIKLSGIDKIDSGEQILFSITTTSGDFLILTGDKNSIRELNSYPGLDNIRLYLKNKIVCLEKLILIFIKTEEISSLVKKVIDSRFCGDKTLELVFDQEDVSMEKIREGLASYFSDLKLDTGQLLYE